MSSKAIPPAPLPTTSPRSPPTANTEKSKILKSERAKSSTAASNTSSSTKEETAVAVAGKYILTVVIKNCKITGGGVQHRGFVEMTINNEVVHTTQSLHSPWTFEEQVVRHFTCLEDIDIGFAVYKKKWTSSGFKLVGTHHCKLADISGQLNKGPIIQACKLCAAKRNLSLGGMLALDFCLDAPQDCSKEEKKEEKKRSETVAGCVLCVTCDFDNKGVGEAIKTTVFVLALVLLAANAIYSIRCGRANGSIETRMEVLMNKLVQTLSPTIAVTQ
jgi:hypothetical protein